MEEREGTTSPDFRALFEAAPVPTLVLTPDLVVVAVSEAYLRLAATHRDAVVGRRLLEVFPRDDTEAPGTTPLESSLRRVLELRRPQTMAVQTHASHGAKGEGEGEGELDGRVEERYWRPVSTPVLGQDGAVAFIIHRLEDVSEVVRLKQHGMDAVRQLAGGVAHDFNNLLSVMLGYTDVVLLSLADGDPRREDLEEVRSAGQRAAELTRQLLAFGRQSMTTPRVVDPNALLGGLESMLRRLLGADIELSMSLAPSVGRVRAEPAQLEQLVVNLATNAREAMPNGGRLVLATANVDIGEEAAWEHAGATPGRHVKLTVRDTGAGMSPATQARMFEPFFTTKAKGKGTGLGLSIVFGIVQQSRGFVRVDSAPGAGTTFEIHLPRVDGVALDAAAAAPASERGSKIIEA